MAGNGVLYLLNHVSSKAGEGEDEMELSSAFMLPGLFLH